MLSDAESRRQYEFFLMLSRHESDQAKAEILRAAVTEHLAQGWTFESSWGDSARLFRIRRAGLLRKQRIETLVVKVDGFDGVVSRKQWEESMADRRRRDSAMPDFSEDLRRLGF